MIGKLIILIFIISFILGYFGVKVILDVDVKFEREKDTVDNEQNNTANNTTNMSYYINEIWRQEK